MIFPASQDRPVGGSSSPALSGRRGRKRKLNYQLLCLLDLPVHILDEGPFLTCKLRHPYRLLLLFNGDFARRLRVDRVIARDARRPFRSSSQRRFLTAALDPNPADLRGDVSCQNGVLLLVTVDERRHLGLGCAIDHRRESDGDAD